MEDAKQPMQKQAPQKRRRSDEVECPPFVKNNATGNSYQRMGLLGSGGFELFHTYLLYTISPMLLLLLVQFWKSI